MPMWRIMSKLGRGGTVVGEEEELGVCGIDGDEVNFWDGGGKRSGGTMVRTAV